MRLFISLELPKEIKGEIEKIQKKIKKAGVSVRFVKPEIAHLTLVFLGSVAPDRLYSIEKTLEDTTGEIRPIKLKLSRLGFFPSPKKARIIYLNLLGEIGKTNALSIKIKKRFKKEGVWFDKKPFVSHITLGRAKRQQNLTFLSQKIKIKKVEFVASKVCLNKSILTPSGPVYQKLKCVFLK